MSIDNPDIKLVIQWDLPISFDAMIQRMDRAGRKGGQAVFVLFTPKWTRIKDQAGLDERLAKQNKLSQSISTLAASQKPAKPVNPNPLSQAVGVEDASDTSENESILSNTEFGVTSEDLLFWEPS